MTTSVLKLSKSLKGTLTGTRAVFREAVRGRKDEIRAALRVRGFYTFRDATGGTIKITRKSA